MATPAEPRPNKRVLALVKAFLKAGIMTESGQVEDTDTGTPQGVILSPQLANIALSVLEPMGLRLSQAKTQIVQMQDGFDFLGFCIIWKRKRGTDKWYVYTFIADKPVQSLQRKIRSLTHRLSQADYRARLIRINQIQRGWANYFSHAVAKHTFDRLKAFVWSRVVHGVMHRHRMPWKALQRRLRGPTGWRPVVLDGIELFNIASVPVTRYRWRGSRIPTPWPVTAISPTHDLVESRMR